MLLNIILLLLSFRFQSLLANLNNFIYSSNILSFILLSLPLFSILFSFIEILEWYWKTYQFETTQPPDHNWFDSSKVPLFAIIFWLGKTTCISHSYVDHFVLILYFWEETRCMQIILSFQFFILFHFIFHKFDSRFSETIKISLITWCYTYHQSWWKPALLYSSNWQCAQCTDWGLSILLPLICVHLLQSSPLGWAQQFRSCSGFSWLQKVIKGQVHVTATSAFVSCRLAFSRHF